MYVLTLILAMAFGDQTGVVTVSLDYIDGLDACQTIGLSIAEDYTNAGFTLDSLTCTPQDVVTG